jgi:CBS-domain-containing membrane protein
MSKQPSLIGRRTVADVMNCDVVAVSPNASVRELTRVLRDHGITGAPVVEGGTVVGVVTATDVLELDGRAAALSEPPPSGFDVWRGLDEFRVRDIMTTPVLVVEPSLDLDSLRQAFIRTGAHRALVRQEGALVGVVSLSDLLAAIADNALFFAPRTQSSDAGNGEETR